MGLALVAYDYENGIAPVVSQVSKLLKTPFLMSLRVFGWSCDKGIIHCPDIVSEESPLVWTFSALYTWDDKDQMETITKNFREKGCIIEWFDCAEPISSYLPWVCYCEGRITITNKNMCE